MPNKVTYEYAIIRLVPKVEREEFLNIGVILFSKRKRFLAMRYQLDVQRIEAFAPEVNVDMIEQYLKAWDLVCQGSPEGGRIGTLDVASRFRWLVASRSTIIQSSNTHPGLCVEPETVLVKLFERYVK